MSSPLGGHRRWREGPGRASHFSLGGPTRQCNQPSAPPRVCIASHGRVARSHGLGIAPVETGEQESMAASGATCRQLLVRREQDPALGPGRKPHPWHTGGKSIVSGGRFQRRVARPGLLEALQALSGSEVGRRASVLSRKPLFGWVSSRSGEALPLRASAVGDDCRSHTPHQLAER